MWPTSTSSPITVGKPCGALGVALSQYAAWPLDYLDDSTGILVPPSSREALIEGLAQGMVSLGASPELRRRLGQAGRRRIEAEFDWERKMDTMMALYQRLVRAAVPA